MFNVDRSNRWLWAVGAAFSLQIAFCVWVWSLGGYRAIPIELFGVCQIVPGVLAVIFAGQRRWIMCRELLRGSGLAALASWVVAVAVVWMCVQFGVLQGEGTLLDHEQAMQLYPMRGYVANWMLTDSGYLWFLLCLAPLLHMVNAACEELMWRGYLLTALTERFGQHVAAASSALIWGLWHAPMVLILGWAFPGQPLVGAVVFTVGLLIWGVVLARLKQTTGGLLAPVVMHATFNAWMIGYFNLQIQESDGAMFSPWGPLGWAFGGVVALAVYHFRPDQIFDDVAPHVETAQSQYLELKSGLRIHYTDTGTRSGQVVVLLHGFMASLRDFDAWVQPLGKFDRVLRLDLPGMGLTAGSPAVRLDEEFVSDCLVEFLDRMGVRQAAFVGHSRGGYAAWVFAIMHPERVNKLVLISAAGLSQGHEPRRAPLSFRLAEYAWLKPVLRYVAARWLVRLTLKSLMSDPRHVTQEWVDRAYRLTLLTGNRSTFLRLRPFWDRPDLQARLSDIKVPTLILWGCDDYLIPVRHAHLFQAAVQHAQVKVYAGVAHYPMAEANTELLDDLVQFLEPARDCRHA